MADLLELDGSEGEGGGQILRTALTLSLVTGRPFHLRNVRANRRPKPGLQPQHLTGVRAAAEVGGARVVGDSLGSTDLTFHPGTVSTGAYRFAVGTAGAVGLVLHAVYLPLALAADGGESELLLEGGTHVRTSPSFDFLDVTWRAHLARLGLRVSLELVRPGFYPRGGGAVRARIFPWHDRRIVSPMPAGDLTRAAGFAAIAGLPEHVGRRMLDGLRRRLSTAGITANIELRRWEGGPGAVAAVIFDRCPVPALFLAVGERGKPAEAVADEAADKAIAFAAAGEMVDEHSADQLVLPLALVPGTSEYRVQAVTRHLTTNVAVIRRFIDRPIIVEGEEGEPGAVRVG